MMENINKRKMEKTIKKYLLKVLRFSMWFIWAPLNERLAFSRKFNKIFNKEIIYDYARYF